MLDLPERERSLVDDYESEWRNRPVNVMKIFKSLYNQLTEGADLTRISMPCEICHPYSALEVVGHRELSAFHNLFAVNDHPEDDFERFMVVVRWVLTYIGKEKFEKKPFNPTIGEVHLCWVENSEDDWSEFIAEQVSHHPPLTAFIVRNLKQEIALSACLGSQVTFGANNIVVTGDGGVTLQTKYENYTMLRHTPNLMIQRIIWGEKYYMWDGAVNVDAQTSGYKLELVYSEKNESTNKIKGQISKNGQILYKVDGAVGKVTYYWKPDEGKKKKAELWSPSKNTQLLVINYLPVECRVGMNAMRVWKDVCDAIIKDNMQVADQAKKRVEAEQRTRERAREALGSTYQAVYFDPNEEDKEKTTNLSHSQNSARATGDKHVIRRWQIQKDVMLNRKHLEELKEKVVKENEERASKEKETGTKQEMSVECGDGLTTTSSSHKLKKGESKKPASRSSSTSLKKGGKNSTSDLLSPRNDYHGENANEQQTEGDENCIIS
jgi:hypothetical protein